MVKRRTPLGTQPPISSTDGEHEASGVILVPAPPGLDEVEAVAAPPEPETSIVVDLDDSWLDRLDLAD